MSKLRKSLLWPIFATNFIFLLYETAYFAWNPLVDRARWGSLALWWVAFVLLLIVSRPPRKLYAFDFLALLLISFCFISTTYSIDPTITWQRSLSALLLYGAVFWCVWGYADSVGDEKVINTMIATAALFYIVSLSLIVTPVGWLANTGRFTGVFRNPNFLGLLPIVILPLVLVRVLHYRRWFDNALLLVILVSLITSGSRAGILACSVSTLFILYTAGVGKVFLSLGAVVVWVQMLFALGVFDTGALEEFGFTRRLLVTAFSFNSTSEVAIATSGRLNAWQLALLVIQNAPLVGQGFGTEATVFNISSEDFDLGGLTGASFFNSYLGMTVQLGLVGMVLFFVPLFLLVVRSPRKGKRRDNIRAIRAREDLLQCALRGVILGGLVSAAFESWVYSAGNGISFMFWTCVMLLLRSSTTMDKHQRLRQKLRIVLLRELLHRPQTVPAPVTSPVASPKA